MSGDGDDRVPLVLGLLLDHGRQPCEVVDGRRGRVDVGHPGRVERRALARESEQRPESFGPVALDPLARPVQPRHVVLERGAYRVQVRRAQLLVGRLRVVVGHAHSVSLATSAIKQSIRLDRPPPDGCTLPVNCDRGLIANHPGIVARR